MRTAIAAIAALAALAGGVRAEGGTRGTYRQSTAVLAHYPELPVAIKSPALTDGRTTLASQAELEAFAAALADKPNAPIVARTLGHTAQGRSIPILFLTPERHADAAGIRATGRPVVWLIGQQHGNEPAGGEALLAVAKSLAEGEMRPLLDRMSIVIVPRANPDGAAADARDTAAGHDMNRDHLALRLPETRALHAAIQDLPPDLVIDAHEFNVASRWLEKFGGVQAVDLMLLSATHPMVPKAVRQASDGIFRPAIEAAARRYAISTFDYHTTSNLNVDRSIALGGNAAGIARNAFALMGSVSLLLESRGVGVGRDGFQRRVATHYVAIKAVLETVAARGDDLKAAVAEARREIAAARDPLVVATRPATVRVKLPLLDPASGAARSADVEMIDSRSGAVTHLRGRAAAYVVMPEAALPTADLKLLGASACRLAAPAEMTVETFDNVERSAGDLRAINLRSNVKATVTARRMIVPAGALYIPVEGPSALRVTAALEPDLPGSLFALDLLPGSMLQASAPILRVPSRTPSSPCVSGAE